MNDLLKKVLRPFFLTPFNQNHNDTILTHNSSLFYFARMHKNREGERERNDRERERGELRKTKKKKKNGSGGKKEVSFFLSLEPFSSPPRRFLGPPLPFRS